MIHRDVVIITTAQLQSTEPDPRFCLGSNPTLGVSEICDGENLVQRSWVRITLKCLWSVNHSA